MNISDQFPSALIKKAIDCARTGNKEMALGYLHKAEFLGENKKKCEKGRPILGELINKVKNNYDLDNKSNLYSTFRPEGQFVSELFVDNNESIPGVSLVTCCMNRNGNLLKALHTWLKHNDILEIIIVDWSSTYPVYTFLKDQSIIDDRIKIVRVNNEKKWVLSFAFNVGFRMAKHKNILKTDADIIINKDFFKKNILRKKNFIAGDWRKASKGQEHINGFFYIKKSHLLEVKGFNEYITSYGWDDDDLYNRLDESGLARVCVNLKTVYHIPHDDALRVSKTEKKSFLDDLYSRTSFKIRANRYISFVMPHWKKDRHFFPFNVTFKSNNYVELDRSMHFPPHYVPLHIKTDAEYYAATELISWQCGPEIYHHTRKDIENLARRKPLEEINPFDIKVLKELGHKELKRKYLVIDLRYSNDQKSKSRLLNIINDQLSKNDETSLVVLKSSTDGATDLILKNLKNLHIIKTDAKINGLYKVASKEIPFLAQILQSKTNLYIKAENNFPSEVTNNNLDAAVIIKKKKIYVDAQHGLGNRLRAYASAAVLAKKMKRELVVVWVPDNHCECRFDDIFKYDGPIIDYPFDADLKNKCSAYNYMEAESGSVKGKLIEVDDCKDLYVRSAYVLNHPLTDWSKENEELKKLTPVKMVTDLINKFNLTDHIGVHVRMEAGKGLDNNSWDSSSNWSEESHNLIHYWREKSHYSSFIKYIDKLIFNEKQTKIFLATDLEKNYEVFEKYYGNRLKYLKRSVFDRSKEQFIYALADAILLSRCKMLLGSTWSSFSELAMRLSNTYKKIKMSGKDF
jgi:hypothetical protein